jgi:hypothetical protein
MQRNALEGFGLQRRRFSALVLGAGILLFAAVSGHAQQVRDRQLFDNGWRFHLGDVPQGQSPTLADKAWRQLDLPHDWSIEGPYSTKNASGTGFLPGGIGWYRKTFTLPASARGRKVSVRFDGVYRDSTVWINGVRLGTRPYGYFTFEHDLTSHLRSGAPNVIAVRVDHSVIADSRWYPGSGIYRHVCRAAPESGLPVVRERVYQVPAERARWESILAWASLPFLPRRDLPSVNAVQYCQACQSASQV